MELKLFLSLFLLLSGFTRLGQAQLCPPNVIAVFTTGDRTIHLPLTVPLCIACRFLDNQGDREQFNDGVWTIVDGITLTDDSFNGNVTLTNNSETTAITLTYPDTAVNAGDQIRCTSPSLSRNHLITIGPFVFLEPTVTPNGTINVLEGSNVTLTCYNPGNTGNARYIWINDTDDSTLTQEVNNPPLTLTLNNINTTASGVYTCQSSNTDLPDVYMETNVTIIVQNIDIYISQDKTFTIGDYAIINCTFNGLAANVTWMKDGHLHSLSTSTQYGYSLLNLSSLTLNDNGCYSCVINSTGNSTCVSLEVQQASTTTSTSVKSNSVTISNTNTISLTYSSMISSTMITIYPSPGTPTPKPTDRTVVYVVSILVAMLLLAAIIILAVIAFCFFYRQSKSTEDSQGFVKGTSFRIEEFDFHAQDLEDVDDKKASLPSTPSHKSTDQLLLSNKFEMTDNTITNESVTSSLPETRNGVSSPPPPLPPPYKMSDFGHLEEINIGAINIENEKVIYSQVNKPSSVRRPKTGEHSTPTFGIVDDDRKETHSSKQQVAATSFPEPTSPPPPIPPRIGDTPTSPTHSDSRPPAERILYTEISLPAKKQDEKRDETSSPKKIEQEKVLYSDISKLSRTPSGRIICTADTTTANPLYADLNLIRSQTISGAKEGGAKESSPTTPPPRTEKVVYAEVGSIRKKDNY